MCINMADSDQNRPILSQTDSSNRIRSLDGLRGIAAIAVMLLHFNTRFLPQARLPFVDHAYLAVDLFFLLSGFVMAHVYGHELASDWRTRWRKFAIARFARIYPLFALTTLAMVVILVMTGRPVGPVSFSANSLKLQPFLLQQWHNLSWNYPSWSISTEAEAYVIFIFLARPLVAGRHAPLIAACCVAALSALCISSGGSLNLYSGSPALVRTITEFSLGVLLYRAYSRRLRQAPQWAALIALSFAGMATITKQDFLVIGAFVCLICYSIDTTDVFGRFLNCPLSMALGSWSYSVYLWHAPMHFAVMNAFATCNYSVENLGRLGARLLALATALMVVVLAAFSNKYFENRVRRSLILHSTAFTDLLIPRTFP